VDLRAAPRLREIVFSCVRLRARYDFAIDLRRDARKQPPPRLRVLLWAALHELVESRAPEHAVVDQAVEATRALGLAWAAGFVNGVLRSVLREGIERGFPSPDEDALAHASTWSSHPSWLVERWAEMLGPSEMLELCAANNRRPDPHLRALPGRREQLLRALAVLEWEAVPVECAPDALVLRTRVPPQSIFDQVCEPCAMQDAAAQLVAPLLASALGPGARVLDLCAAPGGKATHLAQLLDERSTVIAADARADRLADLTANLDRLRLHDRIARVVSDGRRPGLLGQAFDGVLVDAPCTGTGVLARRHDARWLRRPEDLVELPRLQVALLGRALDLVRPGGVVVYSTCSLEVEENDEVVDTVLGSREDVEEIGVGQDLPESMRRAGRMQTWPHRHGVDGAFAVRLRRRGGASPTRARGDVS
jgi:16S rRNA (cytosine967-C5)-methyltransferase